MPLSIPFDTTYARLPERFYAQLPPQPVRAPELIELNLPLAAELGLDAAVLASADGVAMLAGNLVPDGAASIALAYAGHQFGSFVPQLGDGRALLLGEIVDSRGQRRDLQLKGSGPTPFSRRGDGRSALGPVLREYVISEAMHALGIPTTRSLAAVATGERVMREAILPGGVLTRVASSHIRVGTFQYFAVRRDLEGLRLLADHVIDRHYPEARKQERPVLAILEGVVARQARLVAQWLHVGFIHGVMNTDNMSLAGETIDYGPCAFMDVYDASTVFSSIDQFGRYAYGEQPKIAQWNLARLAETLLPLIDEDDETALSLANDVINGFGPLFDAAYLDGLRRKIGLSVGEESDRELIRGLLSAMAENRADMTLTFRRLADAAEGDASDGPLVSLFAAPDAIRAWLPAWRERLRREGRNRDDVKARMRKLNPAVIPRNHKVEEALDAAVERADYTPFRALLNAVRRPFDESLPQVPFMEPPRNTDPDYRTFCGT